MTEPINYSLPGGNDGFDFTIPHVAWINEAHPAQDGSGYIPNLVFENQPGYYPLSGGKDGAPWVWGPSLDEAKAQADSFNREVGIDPDTARSIIASSIIASLEQERAQ